MRAGRWIVFRQKKAKTEEQKQRSTVFISVSVYILLPLVLLHSYVDGLQRRDRTLLL